jgi:fatty acid desaturase
MPEHSTSPSPTPRHVEWPTLALAAVIYGGWLALTLLHHAIPPAALAILGGWTIAWQGSLQHETIHGHPTPWARINAAIGAPPLSLWLPYGRYRRTHLDHHASEHLTHPAFDPEARYLPAEAGRRRRLLAAAQASLSARLVLGPVLEIAAFVATEAHRLARGEAEVWRAWSAHAAAVGAVWAWLHFACGLGLARYLLCFVYPGVALSMIRSFAEHRAAGSPGARVAVVEHAPVLGLLFLNNNLHAVHHAWPELPWWRLPARYRQRRGEILLANEGLVYSGYADVFRRYAFRPHDVATHPLAKIV